MQRLDVLPWEANHPLNGHPCPVTGRLVYIENGWKITRPDYRLRSGILEPGVVLSLPVGYTKTADTNAFFNNMQLIRENSRLNADRFVLIEDYAFHTGSDYEGRLTYIRRMIDEISPAGIVFITRSKIWRLSINIGKTFYPATFPIKCVSTYREALQSASEMLGRRLAGGNRVRTTDKIDNIHFAVEAAIQTPSLVRILYSGCPTRKDLSWVTEFFMGLPDHPKLAAEFRAVHDFSAMETPTIPVLYQLLRVMVSPHCNSGNRRMIIRGRSLLSGWFLRFLIWRSGQPLRLELFRNFEACLEVVRRDIPEESEQSGRIQMNAMEMLDTINWEKPGYYELESVTDPVLRPLALMLGALKQDVDHYLAQRNRELEKLQEANIKARLLSDEIDRAYKRSERDRLKSEVLSGENLSLSLEIAKAQKEVFLVLADYIDKRAGMPMGTTIRLARMVCDLATLFNYTEGECTHLHDATLLYHAGYLGIPEREPDPKLHCSVGSEVLSNIDTYVMQYASHIAHYHHEKWNGTGYPEGLIGDLIPREARLVALAEFLLTCGAAQFEYRLQQEAGSTFDPTMVRTLLLHREKVLALLSEPDEILG